LKKDKLLKVGLKSTAPRIKILHMLEKANPRHVSAENIYKKLLGTGEDIALATVYRVLLQFEQARLIIRHNFEEGRSVFELAEGAHHDHLVCIQCHMVAEFVDAEIEKRQVKIAMQAGFKMTDHHLTIYGVCQQCHQIQT
jgi:Fur family ferric uptake transcriptional regulator